MSAVFLTLALLFQGLTYSLHTWSFTGVVLETRQVERYGMPTEVARVRSADFDAWVILRMDTEGPDGVVVLGSARPGDRVRVFLTGPHVLKNQIDWSLCGDSATCRLGYFYDDGLFSPDWNVPITPSNEFIHLGHPNPSWEQALFWNTEKLIGNGNIPQNIVNSGRISKIPGKGSTGCGAIRQSCVRLVATLDSHDTVSLSRLAKIAIARIRPAGRAGRNSNLAAFPASRTCPVRIRAVIGGDCLAGNACRILLQHIK